MNRPPSGISRRAVFIIFVIGKMKRTLTALVMACIMAICCMGAPVFALAEEPALSEEVKQEYYAEYSEIVKEVAEETEWVCTLTDTV